LHRELVMNMFFYTVLRKKLILDSLKVILTKYRSAREMYNVIKPAQWQDEKERFSYSHFNRYLKGEIPIPDTKEDVFIRFLHNNFNLALDLVEPNIDIDLHSTPIQIDISRLLSYPDLVNLLTFHVINQDHLKGKFDIILTHSEAIPLAVSFSQSLQIPWVSVTFRSPPVHSSKIQQVPYSIDQELIATAYFYNDQSLLNKEVLVITDYIRRGGFLDILFRVAEDNNSSVQFLFAVIGIGRAYRRFNDELEGNMRVVHLV
ncbi:MAG: hypothetical protein JSV04_13935, partial [Candidatus Heimdallarchaeota archaeon]